MAVTSRILRCPGQGPFGAEILALQVGNCQEDHHNDGGEHLQVVGLQTQQHHEVVDDVVDDAAAYHTDQTHHEIGLDL